MHICMIYEDIHFINLVKSFKKKLLYHVLNIFICVWPNIIETLRDIYITCEFFLKRFVIMITKIIL